MIRKRTLDGQASGTGMLQRRGERRLAVGLGAMLAMLGPAPAVEAHDPLFLTATQRTPDTGPLLPDGTISFALYGEIGGEGDSRGFQVGFQDGDAMFFEMLVPDEAPENRLEDAALPTARIVAPDGTETSIGGSLEGSFFEPFTSTSYLRLGSVSEVAVAGTYDVWITGASPARFTVAVGTRETFGTPVERVQDRLDSFPDITAALDEWLATPPGDPAPGGEQTTGGIDDETGGVVDAEVEPAPDPEPLGDGGAVEPSAAPAGDGSDASVIRVIVAAVALVAPAAIGWSRRRGSTVRER